MSEFFAKELKRRTNTTFDLAFLYSTINEAFHRHIPPGYMAMFESQKPVELENEDFIWADLRSPRTEPFDCREDVEYAPRVFEECSENGVRPREKPGWLGSTIQLATNTLRSLEYTVVSKFEQFQVGPGSILLRAETDRARVYLKTSNKREGTIADCLSSIAPELVRKPLHVDRERGWMLMEDYGPTLDDRMSRQDSENIKHLLARLQRKASEDIERLIECGVPRLNPSDLLRRTEKMLDDVFLTEDRDNTAADSTESEVTETLEKSVVESYKHAVGALLKHLYEKQKIPLTINHGDLYDGNIIKPVDEKEGYVIFDWGAAYLDLPFTGADCLLKEGSKEGEDITVDSYLEHCTEYASLEKLKELRKYLQMKGGLVKMLRRYYYAVDKEVFPCLEEHDATFLRNLLNVLKEAVVQLEG